MTATIGRLRFLSFMGPANRKIKLQSWLTAGVLLALGGLLFQIVSKARDIWAGFDLPQPPPIAVIFRIGPYGWLGLSVVAGVGLILNDLNSRPSFWRNHLGAILLFQFVCAVMAVSWSLFSILLDAGGIH